MIFHKNNNIPLLSQMFSNIITRLFTALSFTFVFYSLFSLDYAIKSLIGRKVQILNYICTAVTEYCFSIPSYA